MAVHFGYLMDFDELCGHNTHSWLSGPSCGPSVSMSRISK